MEWGVDYAYNEWLERNKEMDGERIIRFYERNKFYKWLWLFGGCFDIWVNRWWEWDRGEGVGE